jgi:hypothetical protein
MTLLETMVALTILATGALALLEIGAAGARAETLAARLENELAAAERLLAAHTLLSRVDLDRRIGLRDAGDYVVGVQRPQSTLYRVAVSRAASPGVEVLVTVVYRPEVPEPRGH